MKNMDSFDYSDKPVRPAIDTLAIILNLLTVLVLLLACGISALFLVIFVEPNIAFNPFPPPTLPALSALPTLTPTPRNVFPPTWTPTVTLEPTSTRTPEPTLVPTETQPGVITSTAEAGGTPVPTVGMAYVLQPGNPIAIPNIGHPDAGCNWMGVAGQATGLNGASMVGLFVQLGGALGGKTLSPLTMTGTATQYGSGGYELVLGDRPQASRQSLWVQLLSQDGSPLSDKIFFDTFAECEKNLILINFNQVR
jgi:hypothetical protein